LLKRIGLDNQLRKIGSPINSIVLRTSQARRSLPLRAGNARVFAQMGGQGVQPFIALTS